MLPKKLAQRQIHLNESKVVHRAVSGRQQLIQRNKNSFPHRFPTHRIHSTDPAAKHTSISQIQLRNQKIAHHLQLRSGR